MQAAINRNPGENRYIELLILSRLDAISSYVGVRRAAEDVGGIAAMARSSVKASYAKTWRSGRH